MNPFVTVATFIKQGGPFMYVILVLAVIVVAIIVERMIVIGAAAAVNGSKMADDLVRCIGRGDVAGARNICSRSGSPVAKVAQAVLHAGSVDENRLHAAAEDAAALAMPALTRRLGHLNIFANVATLLGLLGTIFGLTTAFASLGAVDPSQRSALLAAGISEALNCTAFGLMVAVPTLVAHGYLAAMAEGAAERMEEMGIRLSRAIAHASTQQPQPQQAPQVYTMQGAR